MCYEPITSSAVASLPCQVLGNSQLDEVAHLSFWLFPLFPYTHTYSVIEPTVDVIYVILHAGNPIVVKPSPSIYLNFLKAWLD